MSFWIDFLIGSLSCEAVRRIAWLRFSLWMPRKSQASVPFTTRIIPTTLRMVFIPMLLYQVISARDLQKCIQYTYLATGCVVHPGGGSRAGCGASTLPVRHRPSQDRLPVQLPNSRGSNPARRPSFL